MNIIQCKFCKKPFVPISGTICPDCMQQLDKDVIAIRDYIDENPRSNIDQISEDTEIPTARIMYLIKEERIIIDSPDGTGGGLLKCESCGAPINTGRLCDRCKKELAEKMKGAASHGRAAPAAKNDPFKHSRAQFGK